MSTENNNTTDENVSTETTIEETTTDLKEDFKTAVTDAKEGKLQVGAVVRLIVLVIAWINQIAVTVGGYSIPAASEDVVYLVATAITVIATLCVYWHNNSWSLNAKTADAILEILENSGITVDEVAKAVGGVIDKHNETKKNKTSVESTTTVETTTETSTTSTTDDSK